MSAEIVKRVLRACEADDAAALSHLLADDFVFSGALPQPLGKAEFLGIVHTYATAFPGYKFNEGEVSEQSGHYVVTSRISGTNTGPVTLPGLPAIPATGKTFQQPGEPQTYTITNGQVSKIEISQVPGGGFPGILAQLGIKLHG